MAYAMEYDVLVDDRGSDQAVGTDRRISPILDQIGLGVAARQTIGGEERFPIRRDGQIVADQIEELRQTTTEEVLFIVLLGERGRDDLGDLRSARLFLAAVGVIDDSHGQFDRVGRLVVGHIADHANALDVDDEDFRRTIHDIEDRLTEDGLEVPRISAGTGSVTELLDDGFVVEEAGVVTGVLDVRHRVRMHVALRRHLQDRPIDEPGQVVDIVLTVDDGLQSTGPVRHRERLQVALDVAELLVVRMRSLPFDLCHGDDDVVLLLDAESDQHAIGGFDQSLVRVREDLHVLAEIIHHEGTGDEGAIGVGRDLAEAALLSGIVATSGPDRRGHAGEGIAILVEKAGNDEIDICIVTDQRTAVRNLADLTGEIPDQRRDVRRNPMRTGRNLTGDLFENLNGVDTHDLYFPYLDLRCESSMLFEHRSHIIAIMCRKVKLYLHIV